MIVRFYVRSQRFQTTGRIRGHRLSLCLGHFTTAERRYLGGMSSDDGW